MKKYLSGFFTHKTDMGRVRMTNEDRAIALTNSKGNVLLLVCDGMGGQSKGDLASELASTYIAEEFRNKTGGFFNRATAIHWLKNVIRKANTIVFNESCSKEEYQGMGTTLTAVLVAPNYLVIAQVGDSRAYILEGDSLNQITEDQTYVAYLMRTGQITYDEAKVHPKRHVLLNALGIYPAINIDIRAMNYDRQRILVCSDGLYNNLSHGDLENVMKNNDSVELKVSQLIRIANSNGGSDNIAVIIWEAN